MRQKIGQLGVISRFVFGKDNMLQTITQAPIQ
jgi:hypothetical protein